MRKLLLHIYFFTSALSIHAQDMHFSQFIENPAMLNPALTGVASPFRGSLSYRSQWRNVSAPYKTFGVSFETRLNNGNWKQVDKFRSMTFKERSVGRLAWGLSVYNDKAGTPGLSVTRGNFNVATFVPVSKKSFIALGFQATLVQRKIENGTLLFPDQYGPGGYDPVYNSAERFNSLIFTYGDYSAGALWSYRQEEKRITTKTQVKGNAGFSVYHFTQPEQAFLLTKQTTRIKYITHGELTIFPSNSNLALVPSLMAQIQGPSHEITGGLLLKYYLKDNAHYTGFVKRSSVGYGLYGRSKDAMIISVLYELQEQYLFCMSYDINISALAAASGGRGAIEMTLRYTPPAAFLDEKKPKME
jgi:type IX secretion system PorP/SprF family membrane protein